MQAAIVEIDVHGMTCSQAILAIDAILKKSNSGTYRIRVIHGYHGGTNIKNMLLEEYGYQRCDKVKRIVPGNNQGVTELVLREL